MRDDRRRLTRAYHATDYRIETDPADRLPYVTLRIGRTAPSALDRLLRTLHADRWAYLTADNPASEPVGEDLNAPRRHALRRHLRDGGWGVLSGHAVAHARDWPDEHGLLVVDMGESAARTVGRRFGQNAVLCGRRGHAIRLVWCDDRAC